MFRRFRRKLFREVQNAKGEGGNSEFTNSLLIGQSCCRWRRLSRILRESFLRSEIGGLFLCPSKLKKNSD